MSEEKMPWWLQEWCRENGYTDPCWVNEPDQLLGGRWWAFPPHGVMPLPVDPLGLGEALKSVDRFISGLEQGVDEAVTQVESVVSPLIDQFEDTCESLVKGWGLDRMFD